MMLVSLTKLLRIVNPLDTPPWKEITSSISKDEINSTIATNYGLEYDPFKPQTRQQHIRKIAYFVKNGWNDDPITIIFHQNIYPIYDGNHRLCAAIVRNDEYIFANVEGSFLKIKEISY